MANRTSKFNLGIVLGAVVGGAVAYFLSPRSGKENRDMVKKKINELNKMLEEGEITERVREIYGEFTEQGRKTYTMARKELDSRIGEVKKSVNDIDQEKYKAIVDDVIARVKEETKDTQDRLTQLREYFMDRFNQTTKHAKKDAEDVKKDVKKATQVDKKAN